MKALVIRLMALVAPPTAPAAKGSRDAFRELVETIVFVVVLVLMLKLFVVEAFVIPTGSMAETLYGYQKNITCSECKYTFPVNASREAEATGEGKSYTTGYCCPNCRYCDEAGARDIGWTSGDRVIVGKHLDFLERNKVVVFKFPDAPQTGQVAQNYIKRLVGLPGETIAIRDGDLYVTRSLTYDPETKTPDGSPLYPRPANPNELWRIPYRDQVWNSELRRRENRVRWPGPDYCYTNSAAAKELFSRSLESGFQTPGGFEMVRKSDDLVLEMMRVVNDNEYQPESLAKAGATPRWATDETVGAGWKATDAKAPKSFGHSGGDLGWIRYRNLLPVKDPNEVKDPKEPKEPNEIRGWKRPRVAFAPAPITNFLGYNSGYEGLVTTSGLDVALTNLDNSDHWVGDLILECEVKIADENGAVALELSKGTHRYRAEFEKGQVRLKMFPGEKEVKPAEGQVKPLNRVPFGDDANTLATLPISMKTGTHKLRFANVDCRLRVWIDGYALDFGGKADYAPPVLEMTDNHRWTLANDVNEPVNIGASGNVEVGKLKVLRDTYYVNHINNDVATIYVQPGHYLCMGDNSSQSSDGRYWGLVPERLMLGRAVFVFFPFTRMGFIR